MNEPVESTPQLPHAVYGIAYEDAMGGVSVDLCMDEDGDTEPSHLLDRRPDSELVIVVPASEVGLGLCMAAPKLRQAIKRLLNTTELNLDEIEESTEEAIDFAMSALEDAE